MVFLCFRFVTGWKCEKCYQLLHLGFRAISLQLRAWIFPSRALLKRSTLEEDHWIEKWCILIFSSESWSNMQKLRKKNFNFDIPLYSNSYFSPTIDLTSSIKISISSFLLMLDYHDRKLSFSVLLESWYSWRIDDNNHKAWYSIS